MTTQLSSLGERMKLFRAQNVIPERGEQQCKCIESVCFYSDFFPQKLWQLQKVFHNPLVKVGVCQLDSCWEKNTWWKCLKRSAENQYRYSWVCLLMEDTWQYWIKQFVWIINIFNKQVYNQLLKWTQLIRYPYSQSVCL